MGLRPARIRSNHNPVPTSCQRSDGQRRFNPSAASICTSQVKFIDRVAIVLSMIPSGRPPLVLNRRTALSGRPAAGPRGFRFIPTVARRPAAADVVRTMPRREPLISNGPEFNSPRERKYRNEVHGVTPFGMPRRVLAWLAFYVSLFGGNLWDRVCFRRNEQRSAARLRRLLEKLGTTGIKIGQLITVNAHVMPVAYADELGQLFDSVEPMPVEQAIAIIEEEQRRPLREIFATFDPKPIGSGAVACVYQAKLLTGELVAVKVRRPGIEKNFRTDFRVLNLFQSIGEFLGASRMGQTPSLLKECEQMLTDEMNLLLEARQIEVFRNTARDRIDFVTAPRVFAQYSTPRMLVTAQAVGISIREILNALQKNNRQHLALLTNLGYDFSKISRRLLHLFYWQTFESMVFHADLHPANIFVTPDLRIMLVDFGCCGTIPPKYRRAIYGFFQSVDAGDLGGAVRNVIGLSEPLPPIDVQKYTFEMTSLMRDYMIHARSEHVPWQEKCNLNPFRQALLLGRSYGVPLRPELLRYFRAIRHLDFMIYRLDPKVDPSRQFRKYFHKRAEVARRKARRALKDTVSMLYDNLSIDAPAAARTALASFSKMQDLLEMGSFQFGSALQKLPYVFATIMTTVLRVVVVAGAVTGISTLHWEITKPADTTIDFWDHLKNTMRNDAIEVVMVLFALTALLKIVTRLRQADVDRK